MRLTCCFLIFILAVFLLQVGGQFFDDLMAVRVPKRLLMGLAVDVFFVIFVVVAADAAVSMAAAGLGHPLRYV